MARLRSARTGSVVNVDDVTAAQLGQEWEPADEVQEEKPAPRKATRRKATDGDDGE